MEKKYFVVRQLPNRQDFMFTMTDEERQIMLVCVNDEVELEEILNKDPAGKINYFETALMVAVVPVK